MVVLCSWGKMTFCVASSLFWVSSLCQCIFCFLSSPLRNNVKIIYLFKYEYHKTIKQVKGQCYEIFYSYFLLNTLFVFAKILACKVRNSPDCYFYIQWGAFKIYPLGSAESLSCPHCQRLCRHSVRVVSVTPLPSQRSQRQYGHAISKQYSNYFWVFLPLVSYFWKSKIIYLPCQHRCWLCGHRVRVVNNNDYADTRILRISSRNRNSSWNRFGFFIRVEFLDKKGGQNLVTLSL